MHLETCAEILPIDDSIGFLEAKLMRLFEGCNGVLFFIGEWGLLVDFCGSV
jgi:hypothetical protein